jgi:predicted transcriptional regulator
MNRSGRRGRRVNMTTTVPTEVKARVHAFADYENNWASRIVENAIVAYLGTWGTEEDESPDAEARRSLVRVYLDKP